MSTEISVKFPYRDSSYMSAEEQEAFSIEFTEKREQEQKDLLRKKRDSIRKELIRYNKEIAMKENLVKDLCDCPYCYSDKVLIIENKNFVQIRCDACNARSPKYFVKKRREVVSTLEKAKAFAISNWNSIFYTLSLK